MEVCVSIVDTDEAAADDMPAERFSVRISVSARNGDDLPTLDADTIAKIVELFVAPQSGGESRNRIPVKHGKRITFVDHEKIDWIKAEGNYVLLHADGHSHMVRERIGALEQQLDPARFRRIHRSTIVNVDRIRELRPREHGGYDVVLANGTHLEASRRYRDQLRTARG